MRWVRLLLLFPVPLSVLAATPCGFVSRSKNSVHVQRNQKVIRASKKLALFCQDVIVTGKNSKAILQLPNTRIVVGPNARLKIKYLAGPQHSNHSLNLIYGRLRAKYDRTKSENAAHGLKIHTATAVAGVRGTDFVLSFDPNTRVTRQTTLSGAVLLKLLTSERSVLVKAGQTVTMLEPIPTGFMIASKKKGKKRNKKKKKTITEQTTSSQQLENIKNDLSFE